MLVTYLPPTEIDLANAADFAAALRGALAGSDGGPLVIEASRFTCFGSTAVHVLRDLVDGGHELVLANPTPLVRLVVEQCGLDVDCTPTFGGTVY